MVMDMTVDTILLDLPSGHSRPGRTTDHKLRTIQTEAEAKAKANRSAIESHGT